MASSSNQGQDRSNFTEFMAQQERDLSELLQALSPTNGHADHTATTRDDYLRHLIHKNIEHFEEYSDRRISLAREDVSPFFMPPWCSSLENSLLWLGGCRPSIFIRLVYALSGSQTESQLQQILQGIRTGDLGELTASQLGMISNLQMRVVQEEEQLSSRLASLQEKIADQPITAIVSEPTGAGIVHEPNRAADEALDEHEKSMVSTLEEADKLRLDTLAELTEDILTPLQAIHFLVAGKKLQLCVHEWGKRRDCARGRTRN